MPFLAEPRGLVSSRPGLHPADLLTSAAFGRPAALDVSIACPDAEGAGLDACAATTTAARKFGKYGDILDELREDGIDYRPLVWCWGRPGGDAQAVRSIASVARRRGLRNPDVLERHIRSLGYI